MNEENPISQTKSEETGYIPSKVAIKTDYRIDDNAHALGVTFSEGSIKSIKRFVKITISLRIWETDGISILLVMVLALQKHRIEVQELIVILQHFF